MIPWALEQSSESRVHSHKCLNNAATKWLSIALFWHLGLSAVGIRWGANCNSHKEVIDSSKTWHRYPVVITALLVPPPISRTGRAMMTSLCPIWWLHPLISCTCSSWFTAVYEPLTLVQCQIGLCDIGNFPAFISGLPACPTVHALPWLFLGCVWSLFSLPAFCPRLWTFGLALSLPTLPVWTFLLACLPVNQPASAPENESLTLLL